MIATKFPPHVKSYTGWVTKIYPATDEDVQLWHVVYSDGDEADLEEHEMIDACKLYVDEMGGEEEEDSGSDEQCNPWTWLFI